MNKREEVVKLGKESTVIIKHSEKPDGTLEIYFDPWTFPAALLSLLVEIKSIQGRNLISGVKYDRN